MSFESHNAAVLANLQCKIDNLDLHSYRTDDHADRLPVNHWRACFLFQRKNFSVKLRIASGFLRRYCLVELER